MVNQCLSCPMPRWLGFIFLSSVLMGANSFGQSSGKYAIVIHGGAGGSPDRWSEEHRRQRLDGLRAAIEVGVEQLRQGDAALEVVERVVQAMEDNPVFNAGRGCVLNELGEHELDASIMDGKTLRCGAVASVRRVKHPVALARRVMTDTKHVLLMGSGADEFADALGLELANDDYFRTERQLEAWRRWKEKQVDLSLYRPRQQTPDDDQLYLGTVGCVALDQGGNLAAATSTGGLMGKRWGRVGDSPIIGAGNYADNSTCAVSGTGIGEEFIRHQVASDIAAQMRYAGRSLQAATEASVQKLPQDGGGVIAVDREGNMVMEFNTPGMSRAWASSSSEITIRLSREEE